MFFQQMQKWKTIVQSFLLYNKKIRCHLRFQIYCAMHFLGPEKKIQDECSKAVLQNLFDKCYLLYE